MREIKVRGYATEEMVFGQWMYGIGVSEVKFSEDYAKQIGRPSNWHLMTESGWVRVHEESVGQYTGLKDKRGTEVFEGDVIEDSAGFLMQIKYGEFTYVLIDDTNKDWNLPFVGFYAEGIPDKIIDDTSVIGASEVVGNIYENPELLEGEN